MECVANAQSLKTLPANMTHYRGKNSEDTRCNNNVRVVVHMIYQNTITVQEGFKLVVPPLGNGILCYACR